MNATESAETDIEPEGDPPPPPDGAPLPPEGAPPPPDEPPVDAAFTLNATADETPPSVFVTVIDALVGDAISVEGTEAVS